MEQRKQRTLAIFALALALIATSVAYAALSTTLTISGNVTKKGGSFSVVMQNVKQGTTVGSGKITSVKLNGTDTVNFGISLEKPGDSASFSFDVYNAGTIDAIVNDYLDTSFRSSTATVDATRWEHCDGRGCFPENVDCTLSMGGKVISNGTIVIDLPSKGTKTLTVACTYDENATSVSDSDITSNISLSMYFHQK